ncbi:SCO family protein [Crenobacter luteus]|uniref:Electron transporter SenC n=1 Tax=Crenobacter luteus TaxID=1452487 RepID=A0A165F6B5_9NEIS|nr:SCO family protein [Crenobacter luteus]KZE31675.1 electron transporter SenC [Crenobacter luteus]
MNTRRNLLLGAGAAALGLLTWRAAPSRSAATATGDGDALLPNTTVLAHDGRAYRFYDDLVRDKVVAINMMYVQCSGVCPAMTANLRRVQQMLGQRLGRDVYMYSITLRPEQDRPQSLAAYAGLYRIEPDSGWLFLTGEPAELLSLRRQIGFFDPDPLVDGDTASHTGAVRIGNDRFRRWTMAPALAEPGQIVATLNHVDDRMQHTAHRAAT